MSLMATDALIDRLLRGDGAVDSATIESLHELLGDAPLDDDAAPIGIAQTAALVGLTTHTLRYYEQQGLVQPARDAAGYREYGPGDLRRLVFLTRMRLSGMTMQDLTRYVRLVDEGDRTVDERRQMMVTQRARIQRRLRELTLALEATEYKIRVYGGAPDDGTGREGVVAPVASVEESNPPSSRSTTPTSLPRSST